jgi:hypothetical protein
MLKMADFPGRGKSGPFLMEQWRRYLQELADREGDLQAQVVVAGYHAVEILGFISVALDRRGAHHQLIEERLEHFETGRAHAIEFIDSLITITFSLYNHMNTLARQFATGNAVAETFIAQVDEQVRKRTGAVDPAERCAAALEAAFPLLSLMTLILDQEAKTTALIRQSERRYRGGAEKAGSSWDRMVNALYRAVEMMQILVMVSDAELKEPVLQISARFQEEDAGADPELKLRNGFSRLFELGHVLANHLDARLS